MHLHAFNPPYTAPHGACIKLHSVLRNTHVHNSQQQAWLQISQSSPILHSKVEGTLSQVPAPSCAFVPQDFQLRIGCRH